jgi:hypothetical protein
MFDSAPKRFRFPADLEGHVRHFSSTEWVDFVRNVLAAEQQVPMLEHLNQGCGSCLKTVRMWAKVVEFARREPLYEPPIGALEKAESYFIRFRLPLKERADVRILRHVFDSFALGALSGVRGSETTPRQLMYHSYSVFIDLRLEQTPGTDLLALTGQVVDAQLKDGILGEIPVLLLSRGKKDLETTTNQFGEFNLSLKASGHLGLFLGMKDFALLMLLPEDLLGSSSI